MEQFLNVFQTYNLAIWPLQVVVYLLGIAAIALLFTGLNSRNRIISSVLSVMWLINGILYHITFFSTINRAAYVFGILFIIQGLLFLLLGVVKGKLEFGFAKDARSLTGFVFILYSMVIYPLLGIPAGHLWPSSPVFGVAPCPTTIFTFGLLLLSRARVPKWLLVIPLLWSFIGLGAAINFGVFEDYGLVLAGVTATLIIYFHDRNDEISTASAA